MGNIHVFTVLSKEWGIFGGEGGEGKTKSGWKNINCDCEPSAQSAVHW